MHIEEFVTIIYYPYLPNPYAHKWKFRTFLHFLIRCSCFILIANVTHRSISSLFLLPLHLKDSMVYKHPAFTQESMWCRQSNLTKAYIVDSMIWGILLVTCHCTVMPIFLKKNTCLSELIVVELIFVNVAPWFRDTKAL